MVNSIRKGKAGERELCAKLRELGFVNARRTQQYCGDAGDADVADAIPGVHIECKRVQALHLSDAMTQARCDSRVGEIPTVMHRKNHEDWMVTVPLDELLLFAKRVQDYFRTPRADLGGVNA